MKKEIMIVDGIPVALDGERNVLSVIRKAGIQLPTFCYHSELSIHGACRMCMFEDEQGRLAAACSAIPEAGMNIRTNTARLRKYRKTILELILANHCRDCTTCQFSNDCKLQELANRFQIEDVRFPNTNLLRKIDASSPCIVKDQSKCILCGDCVRMCNEIQNVGAIDFAGRGSKMTVSTAFNIPLAESTCVGCGQCASSCPTGAIIVRDDSQLLWDAISDENIKVTAQIAPAVRVAIGRAFGLGGSESAIGQITAALRRIGFDEVHDTVTGADMTVIEEAAEFVERLKQGPHEFPMFTSCCPAWVQFAEKKYPELMENVSTCRSPMQMFASVIKASETDTRRHFHVAIMPCTAKKFEAARSEFAVDGEPRVDLVITTQELIHMIKESGIVFSELEPEAVDSKFAGLTGAGVIFGVSGGVTEAVLRSVSDDKSQTGLKFLALTGVRGMEGIKETTIEVGGAKLRIGIVSGLNNASKLIQKIKEGEHFDLVEVMACPGGCVSGAGQPIAHSAEKRERGEGLYTADRHMSSKRSDENAVVAALYEGILKDRSHELLHVHYKPREATQC
ncbi:MAG: [FeFe] hydrogenase, group A [Oscillospiraceae bacterium]|jgi:NADH-quinone oxidoreductase subunit G|nr:[FeFe] hydrogenase, group A [Oscillospiraceae bacterium]